MTNEHELCCRTKVGEHMQLWQVLVEEYCAQRPEDAPKLLQEDFCGTRAQLRRDYGLIDEAGKARDLKERDRERIEKKINSEMVKKFYAWLHSDGKPRAALCLSGGGIRSATFGLGVLQGLARRGLLKEFDYLSTVSGGGYLGGWLSAWIHRRGLDGVVERLKNNDTRRISPLQPEPEPVKHLRTYSNYMSPKVGLLSADTWTLVAIYFRNLLLNWLVLLPLIIAALILPRLYAWGVAVAQKPWSQYWAREHGATLFLWGVVFGMIAIAFIYLNRPSLKLRISAGWRTQQSFLLFCLLPFFLLTVCSTLAYAWYPVIEMPSWLPLRLASWLSFERNGDGLLRVFIAFGVSLQLGGLILALVVMFFRRSPASHFAWHIWDFIKEFFIALVGGVLSGWVTWEVAKHVFARQEFGVNNFPFTTAQMATYTCFALPLFMLLVLAGVTIFVGFTSRILHDEDREWLARLGGWVLIVCFGWALASFVVVFVPALLADLGPKMRTALTSAGVISGLITLVVGRSEKSPANAKEADKTSTLSSLSNLGLTLAAALFAIFILTLLSMLTGWLITQLVSLLPVPEMQQGVPVGFLDRLSSWLVPNRPDWYKTPYASFDQFGLLNILYYTPGPLLLALFFAAIAVSFLMGLGININKFSLHAAYRDRLIRAYLGASRNERERTPNPFTGFDDQDNIQMQELRTERFHGESIRDLDRLVAALCAAKGHSGDPTTPAEFIYPRLTDMMRGALDEHHIASPPVASPPDETHTEQLKAMLSSALNRIIESERLYTEKVFTDLLKIADASPPSDLDEKAREIKQLFPGEDESIDDVGVEQLRANRGLLELAFPGMFEEAGMCKPMHVVNMALNLVGGEDLAWQNRMAESFTVTPLHAGSYCVGYRDSRVYGKDNSQRAISLGTSVAVSGAAVSPNMGYHSSPFVTFLLTLFNVRLGWWLGNPGKAGERVFDHAGPRVAFFPIISEALGLTNDRYKYVYLSDGGHFENLGLYEMILRRCRFIVVSDGSEDHEYTFEGLGNAISKVRVDLGVTINFEKIYIFPQEHEFEDEEKKLRGYCALGRICYSCVDGGKGDKVDGYLLYIKATLTGTEPKDIYNYAHAHTAFPHESTGDQMYSEEQFESYRELGSHAFKKICEFYQAQATDASPPDDSSIEFFFQQIREGMKAQLDEINKESGAEVVRIPTCP
jgi:hypothetical protein